MSVESEWIVKYCACLEMATVSASPFALLFFARISGLIVAALVVYWAFVFKSSFLPHSSSQKDLIYAVWTLCFLSFFFRIALNPEKSAYLYTSIDGFFFFSSFLVLQVLHPLLMVIGFILISGEGRGIIKALKI